MKRREVLIGAVAATLATALPSIAVSEVENEAYHVPVGEFVLWPGYDHKLVALWQDDKMLLPPAMPPLTPQQVTYINTVFREHFAEGWKFAELHCAFRAGVYYAAFRRLKPNRPLTDSANTHSPSFQRDALRPHQPAGATSSAGFLLPAFHVAHIPLTH